MAPTKVNFFIWELVQVKIIMLDQLKKQECPEPTWCFLYKNDEGSTHHIMFIVECLTICGI